MEAVIGWFIVAAMLLSLGPQRQLTRFFWWYIDMMDRVFNPMTRERIRRQNEEVARFKRDMERHETGRH